MSVPPPPHQPPMGSQPVGGASSGPPPPGGAPQWGPQQPWGSPPGAPPPRGGKGKWIFGGLALLAVIAVTVVITVLVVGKNSGTSPSPTSTTAVPSDIASANDKGAATIITEDPTCAATRPINDTLVGQEKNGWDKRDPSVPASAWTPEVRAQFEAVGQAFRNAANQTVTLAKTTPHRVMRELYEQNIAYSRAYADSIATYSPQMTISRSSQSPHRTL